MILRTAATRSELRPRISPISSGVGTGLPMTWALMYLLYDSFGTVGAAEFQATDPRRRLRSCKGRFGLEVLEQYPVWPPDRSLYVRYVSRPPVKIGKPAQHTLWYFDLQNSKIRTPRAIGD